MSRGYEAKKRNSFTRQRKPVIVFALEGDNQTELNYLRQMARECRGKIVFQYADGHATDPAGMMRALLSKADDCQLDKNDFAFSLVDSDCAERKNKELASADHIAKANKSFAAMQIVSSPCFELWYLLHFEYTTAQYAKSSDVVDRLKTHISDYEKNRTGMYELLRDKQDAACDGAKRLERHCSDRGDKRHTVAFMPSTEMYIVVDAVRGLLQSQK